MLKVADFKDIHHFTDGEEKVFSYRFGNTVYEEVADGGIYRSAGWNTAGFTLNVQEGMNTRLNPHCYFSPQAFDIEVDGRTLTHHWEFEKFESNTEILENGTEVLHGIVFLKSTLLDVGACVHTILDGTSVMTRYITLTNHTDKAINISRVSPMRGLWTMLGQFTRCCNPKTFPIYIPWDILKAVTGEKKGCLAGISFPWHDTAFAENFRMNASVILLLC